MRILLLAGGWSSEREVALSGARGVEAALQTLGHEVVRCDPAEAFAAIPALAREVDFAFLNLHGAPGEDGLIQAMLDRVGCPYQGADPAGSFLALHKAAAKSLFRQAGLTTPDWEFLTRRPDAAWSTVLPLPVFVKPNLGGSSLGMGLAEDHARLRELADACFDAGEEALLEQAFPGHEITCAVLGEPGREDALPPVLIRPRRGAFFDYASKYEAGGAEELCPAPLPPGMTRRVQAMAVAAHRALGLFGYSRADMMASALDDPDAALTLLEVNTLPGMTPTSLLPQAAAAAGMDFPALLARLIELGMART